MTVDSSQIVIPGTASLSLAPVGSTMPASEVASLDVAFIDSGLTTEDGTSFTGNPTFGEVRSHQSPYATRVFKSTDSATLAVVLQQFNGKNLISSLGGGTLSIVTAGHFKYVPPSGTQSAPTAAIFDWQDTYHYRLIIPKCRARTGLAMPLHRTGEIQLPLNLEVEGGGVSDPWYLLTDDAEFTP